MIVAVPFDSIPRRAPEVERPLTGFLSGGSKVMLMLDDYDRCGTCANEAHRPALVLACLAALLFMKASYIHPFWEPVCVGATTYFYPFNRSALPSANSSDPPGASWPLEWKKAVTHARQYLRNAIRHAVRHDLPKRYLHDMRQHLSKSATFSPRNPENSKQPREVVQYLSAAPDYDTQLQRIRALYGDWHILPFIDCEQKLWVRRMTAPHGLGFRGNTKAFLSSIPASRMFENAMTLQGQANKYLRDALAAKTLHHYQYSLHLAAPHFRAGQRAFEGAKKRFVDMNNNAAAGNAEAERYVCDERYVQCKHSVWTLGTYIVQVPFVHLWNLREQTKSIGAQKSATDLISYLSVNDVCFPEFAKTAWHRFTRGRDPLELTDSDRNEYIQALADEMDEVSFRVLYQALRDPDRN